MGLFDSLKKGLSAVANEAEKHKGDLIGGLEKAAEMAREAAGQGTSKPQPQTQAQSQTPAPDYPQPTAPTDRFAHFKEIFEAQFSEWEIRERVSASELDAAAHPKAAPITFLFCKNGAPVLAVLLVRQNNYRGMNVRGTQKILEEKGIRFLRFFEEYPNDEAYVVNRIKQNL